LTDESKYSDLIDKIDQPTETLLADLEALHAVEVPAIPLLAPPAGHSSFLRRHLRPLALAAAGAAALAVFFAAPSFSGGDKGTVSAETILRRTQGVAATTKLATVEQQSYHMLAETEVLTPEQKAFKSRTETWYQDEGHVRIEEGTSPAQPLFGQTRNGDDFWIYGVFEGNSVPASGQGTTRAIHGPAGDLSFGKLPSGLTGGSSLDALLAHLSAKDCFAATQTGQEHVAGRQAYVIEVRPTGDRCQGKYDPGTGNPTSADRSKLARDNLTRLWVDVATFVTLRSEFYAGDELLSRYTVLQFEVSPDFAPGTFTYQPPAGVHVIEVASLGEAKQVLAGLMDPGNSKGSATPDKALPPPNKTP
jgi:hypothetical protein